MNAKRKKAETYILTLMKDIDKSGKNTQRYKDIFSKMSDKQFDIYMKAMRDGSTNLFMYFENGTEDNITMNDIIAIAEKRKVKVFEKLKLYDNILDRWYESEYNAMIINVSVRRLSQYIAHKISLPESDTNVNPVSGQVIREDKGAKMSMIETAVLGSKGLTTTATELIKVRGGDTMAYQAAKNQMETTGKLNLGIIPMENRPRSAITAKVYLLALGIDSNI